MKKIKLAVVFGTRPEAIKMAPVVLQMKKYADFVEPFVVVTAQHREMLDQVLNLFKIKPDFDLNIMSSRQTLFDITCRALTGLDEVFTKITPDMILVHGDTTTTFAAALAAYYKQIPVGHVEAGLRTGNLLSPFPEEANRHLTGVLANFHFAPTKTAENNLLKENICGKKIFITGNTVIDALKQTVEENYQFDSGVLSSCVKSGRRIILVTTHRRENLGEPLRCIYRALRKIVETYDDVEVVFPVHKNPLVQEMAKEELGDIQRVHLVDPLDYQPFANLMAKAYLVLSDSGGLQEEAPALGKPVLVLRDTTERPEAVKAGTVKLVGTDSEEIFSSASKLLDDKHLYQKMSEAINPYGDGFAAQRIIETILYEKKLIQTAPTYFCSDY